MAVGNPLDPAKTINSFHLCNLCSARYYYAGWMLLNSLNSVRRLKITPLTTTEIELLMCSATSASLTFHSKTLQGRLILIFPKLIRVTYL